MQIISVSLFWVPLWSYNLWLKIIEYVEFIELNKEFYDLCTPPNSESNNYKNNIATICGIINKLDGAIHRHTLFRSFLNCFCTSTFELFDDFENACHLTL